MMEPQNTFALLRGQENDTGGVKRPAHLIARGFIRFEPAFGFEAFERGQ